MKYQPRSNFLLSRRPLKGAGRVPVQLPSSPRFLYVLKKRRIINELKEVGMSRYGLIKSETKLLPQILHDDEHIKGVVYGHFEGGSAMMLATDHRALFIDVKPLFVKSDELTYDIVSGVGFGKVGVRTTVTLRTRTGDYTIRTLNFKAAKHFIDYIEQRCLDNPNLEPNRSLLF